MIDHDYLPSVLTRLIERWQDANKQLDKRSEEMRRNPGCGNTRFRWKYAQRNADDLTAKLCAMRHVLRDYPDALPW